MLLSPSRSCSSLPLPHKSRLPIGLLLNDQHSLSPVSTSTVVSCAPRFPPTSGALPGAGTRIPLHWLPNVLGIKRSCFAVACTFVFFPLSGLSSSSQLPHPRPHRPPFRSSKSPPPSLHWAFCRLFPVPHLPVAPTRGQHVDPLLRFQPRHRCPRSPIHPRVSTSFVLDAWKMHLSSSRLLPQSVTVSHLPDLSRVSDPAARVGADRVLPALLPAPLQPAVEVASDRFC